MTWKAKSYIDSNGHASVNILDDSAQGMYGYMPEYSLTTLEAENLIKELRKAINSASSHNQMKKNKSWP